MYWLQNIARAAMSAAATISAPRRLFFIPLSQQRWVIYPTLHSNKASSSIQDKALALVTRQYDKLGTAREKSVKHRLWTLGQRILGSRDGVEMCMARIAMKPWSYKKFIVPKTKAWSLIESAPTTTLYMNDGSHSPALHNYNTPDFLLDLNHYVRKLSTGYHRRKWFYILSTPITIPFMLIPAIPNIPFFYMLWRAWCLHDAAKGASYVSALLQCNKLTIEPSSDLSQCLIPPTSDAYEPLLTQECIQPLIQKMQIIDPIEPRLEHEAQVDFGRLIQKESKLLSKERDRAKIAALTAQKHKEYVQEHA